MKQDFFLFSWQKWHLEIDLIFEAPKVGGNRPVFAESDGNTEFFFYFAGGRWFWKSTYFCRGPEGSVIQFFFFEIRIFLT